MATGLDTPEVETDAGVLALLVKGFVYELNSSRNRTPRATGGCVVVEVGPGVSYQYGVRRKQLIKSMYKLTFGIDSWLASG